MTFRDSTDEAVAREVLRRLRAKGLRSLRAQEASGPVSRTTLASWAGGQYTMKGPTRERCLAWLGEVAQTGGEPLTEGQEQLIAAKWMERMAAELRLRATEAPAGGSLGDAGRGKLAQPRGHTGTGDDG